MESSSKGGYCRTNNSQCYQFTSKFRRIILKSRVFLFIAIIVFLIGCSSNSSSGLFEYENTKLNEALKELSFNPEIPKALPYSPSNTKVDAESISGKEQNLLFVTFINQDKGKTTFSATKMQNAFNFTKESVKISENLEGRYGERKDENSKILKWEKDKIYYELVTYDDSVTKEELVKVADSFYLPE
ncbi:DUF4367 domain-containing protein [Halobacillus trueperi]|uniref:DUF4367 domain-containing protein n=1 Tax=Halobacillus trueperi TaxID=156205 RepID=A0A3E0IYC3_9BACI|nr:DUF4367 domain-containing protein [Halobacillus trueperi]